MKRHRDAGRGSGLPDRGRQAAGFVDNIPKQNVAIAAQMGAHSGARTTAIFMSPMILIPDLAKSTLLGKVPSATFKYLQSKKPAAQPFSSVAVMRSSPIISTPEPQNATYPGKVPSAISKDLQPTSCQP